MHSNYKHLSCRGHVLSYLHLITPATKYFFIAIWTPYYFASLRSLWRLPAYSRAKTLLRSNRRPTWHGMPRLLFRVSRLRWGKFTLYDDTE